jgi:selenium-binding protein 1
MKNSFRPGLQTVTFLWAAGMRARKVQKQECLDQARTNPDFLAVLDFDERSPAYGNVITSLPLPNPGAAGNAPHHVGLSADGRVLATAGLLSVLKGQKEVFFFDVSNPRAPRFLSRRRIRRCLL